MSVFKVALQNIAQGYMDLNPATATPYEAALYGNLGAEMNPSIQRTIYVAGPNRTYRKLKDGDQFTDCNYWKRFAYPQVPLEQAFIEVVTDDGSVYSDVSEENTFPKVYDLTVNNGTTFSANVVDILGDTGGFAVFVQIANNGATAVKVRLNGVANAVFDLGASETQVFNHGDLSISKLEFSNTVSGGGNSAVQVLVSVKSVCNS
jgi:cation diffusion facilitator CzcD-associated flavoprotein CzcO